jgi:hypothetical protein
MNGKLESGVLMKQQFGASVATTVDQLWDTNTVWLARLLKMELEALVQICH